MHAVTLVAHIRVHVVAGDEDDFEARVVLIPLIPVDADRVQICVVDAVHCPLRVLLNDTKRVKGTLVGRRERVPVLRCALVVRKYTLKLLSVHNRKEPCDVFDVAMVVLSLPIVVVHDSEGNLEIYFREVDLLAEVVEVMLVNFGNVWVVSFDQLYQLQGAVDEQDNSDEEG